MQTPTRKPPRIQAEPHSLLAMHGDDTMSLKRVIKRLGVLGPAILVSVELFDPASIVSNTAGGAAVGFSVLWAAFYSGILLIVIQEISARLGVVTGKTLAENIHEKYGKRYSHSLFVPSIFLDFATLTAEVMGLSLAISFVLGIPYTLAVLSSILVTGILVYFASYDVLEKIIMLFVTIIFIAYFYFFFKLNIPLQNVVLNSLIPTVNGQSFYYAEAIIGAAIMPTYVVLHSGLVYEKGWIHHHEKGVEELVERKDRSIASEKVDSVASLLAGTILNVVVVACAAVLLEGKQVSSFLDIASPFYVTLGSLGVALFAVAFAFAGLSAIITVGLGSVYNTFGFLGFEERIKRRRFKLLFILWLMIAAVASFLPDQIAIIVFTQFLNGALLPFIVLPLVLLGRNKKIMGKYRLGKITTFVALATITLTTTLFLMSVISLI
jgi:manganese transport protein